MRRLLIFLPVVILFEIFLWNLPKEIIYADSNLVRGIVMIGTVFVFIPGFLYLALSRLKSKNWKMLVFLSIPLNGIGFASLAQAREVKMLLKDGVWTTGIITNTKSVSRKTVSYDWALIVEYKDKGIIYQTDWEGDYTSSHQTGDTLRIVYLKDFPKIYRIENGDDEFKMIHENN